MHNVLLVDDEKRMLDLLALYLKPHHYMCQKAQSGYEALAYFETNVFDIVLLDIMMADMDGWELCQKIRQFSDVPIIMVTAREQNKDVVKGLKLGADDYITKPFDEAVLLARIEALLRRQTPADHVKQNGLLWDESRYVLSYQNKPIKLTPKEFMMIGYFMKHPNQVFSREKLIDLVWGFDSNTTGRTVDSHVRNIREKIKQAGFPIENHFKTVWGVGYKWLNDS
ncbi:response regulator transcription factor [Lentibacillus sp.]|uniref:response regulator transcription factor n=1 Tax=Lentibacillus sp. TaxID=1925746 RepID=UPI002B4B0A93|nr:response regulator transcription factor [Lentibacillus sp.]HLS10082.1 response regulator transcription factor [Lentibacillus sp.]